VIWRLARLEKRLDLRVVGVKVKIGDGQTQVVRSRVVVDASGQSSLLIDRMNLREWDPELKKACAV
jgi:flavin-dependent dehydrogenase